MSGKMLVNFKNVSVLFFDQVLFSGLSFSVHRGEVLALVGANGCGKSTILNLLLSRYTGQPLHTDEANFRVKGSIVLAPQASVVHLPQHLKEARLPAFTVATGVENAGNEAKLRREFHLQTSDEPNGELSDGELQKRTIVRTLLGDHDIYLFDEPTNYLDIAGITAFEEHIERLKRQHKGVIIVTHDRTLTDNVADETIAITRESIYHAVGGASQVLSVRDTDIESRLHQAKDIKKKIRRLQDDMRAKEGWAASKERQKIGAGRAKPTIAKLAKKMATRAKVVRRKTEWEIEDLEKTKPFIVKQLNLRFPTYEIRNRNAFALKDVWFDYSPDAADFLLEDVSLSLTTRDKVCLMGANGSGKSTLLKLIRKQVEPSKGTSFLNAGVKMAYVSQGLKGFFDKPTLLDNFADCGCDETTIRQYLGAALIRREKSREPLGNFSFGELMRAAIVKCILLKAEFLLLDEPTSHLDLESIEVLENLLAHFGGGFLMISHDRSFVANVTDRLFLVSEGRLTLV